MSQQPAASKSNLTKSGKPKRRLIDIQAQSRGLRIILDEKVTELRKLVTGGVPRLAANGSHQDAVNYKNIFVKAVECWPNSKGSIPQLKGKIDRVNGYILALKAFE